MNGSSSLWDSIHSAPERNVMDFCDKYVIVLINCVYYATHGTLILKPCGYFYHLDLGTGCVTVMCIVWLQSATNGAIGFAIRKFIYMLQILLIWLYMLQFSRTYHHNIPNCMKEVTWLSYVSCSGVAAFHLAACVCTSSSDKELIGTDKACVLTHALHELFSQ